MSGYNFFDNLKIKSVLDFFPLTDNFGFKRVDQTTIVNEGYVSNQDVYAVVSRLASLCADIPLDIYKNGELVTPLEDDFAKFFYSRWNGNEGSKQGLNALYTNLFTFGLAYDFTPIESIGFLPSEQWVLPTQRVTPVVGKDGGSFFERPISYSFYDVNNKIKNILPEELVIIKYYDPTNIDKSRDGLSPLQSVWNTVDSENQRGTAEANLLRNKGIAGFLSPEATKESFGLIGKAGEAARAIAKKLVGGADKFNTVEVIEQPVKYTPIGSNANDLKVIESRMPHLRDICSAYGVSSMLFNDPNSRTHANYEEAKKSMYTDFIIPQVNAFIDQYSRGLIENVNTMTGDRYSLKIDLNNVTVLNPDPETVRQEALLQYEKGLLTKAEVREAINRSPEMEKEELTALESLFRMSPLTANTFINSMTEEDRNVLLVEIGLKK